MKAFKNYLVALDVTESATRNKKLVRWSTPADAGAVPSSWDYTAATNTSGRTELSQANGDIQDAVTLHGDMMIYTDNSVWRMTLVGGKYIFKFSEAFGEFGAIASNCVADIGGKHAVFTNSDFIVHDGQTQQSILRGKSRRWLFNQIDDANKVNCFVINHRERGEVWFCYPGLGNTYATHAFIWNWRTNGTGHTDIPIASHAAIGRLSGTEETWDGDSAAWNTDATLWNEVQNPTADRIVAAIPDATELQTLDQGLTNNGNPILSTITRTDLKIEGQKSGILTCQSIRPRMTTNLPSMTVNIYVGAKYNLDDGITWKGPYPFSPDDDHKIDTRVTGRHFAVRFRYNGTGRWKLSGYEMDVVPAGDR